MSKELIMKLSKNLPLSEMLYSLTAKRRGIDNTPTPQHLESMKMLAENIFQPMRDSFGVPIYVSSGYRSEELNKAIGGSRTSQHSKGEAMDIDMDGHSSEVDNQEVFYYILNNLDFDQLIWEFGSDTKPDWVHVSYNPNGDQRGEVLRAKRNSKGKVYYQIWEH